MSFQREEELKWVFNRRNCYGFSIGGGAANCNGFYFRSHPEVASGRSRPEVASPGPQAGSSGAEPRAIDMIDPGGGLPA